MFRRFQPTFPETTFRLECSFNCNTPTLAEGLRDLVAISPLTSIWRRSGAEVRAYVMIGACSGCRCHACEDRRCPAGLLRQIIVAASQGHGRIMPLAAGLTATKWPQQRRLVLGEAWPDLPEPEEAEVRLQFKPNTHSRLDLAWAPAPLSEPSHSIKQALARLRNEPQTPQLLWAPAPPSAPFERIWS